MFKILEMIGKNFIVAVIFSIVFTVVVFLVALFVAGLKIYFMVH